MQGGKADAIKEVLKSFKADHLDVVQARNTMKDIKGPYCETSPLVKFVRKVESDIYFPPPSSTHI